MFNPLEHGAKPLSRSGGFNPLEHGAKPIMHASQPQSNEPTFIERAKEFGQGVASGIGGLADATNKYVAAPIAHAAGYAGDVVSKTASNMGLNQIGQTIGNAADSAHSYGQDLRQTNAGTSFPQNEYLKTQNQPDKTSEVLKASGSAATDLLPFSAASKGVQLLNKAGSIAKLPWLDKLNTFLNVDLNASTAASFAGMGAGAELAKSDDPNANIAENAAREIVGGVIGGTIPHAAAGAVKGIASAVISPLETALAETTGGRINQEAVNAAKKLGLHLPPSLATDSNIAKGIENTVLKSYFSAKVYNETIEKIPQTMVKEIEKNLDEIGSKVLGTDYKAASSVASDQYKSALQSAAEEWQTQSKVLFDNATKSLTEADVMQTPKTLEVVRSMKEQQARGIREPEGARKAMLDNLTQLEAKLSTGSSQVRDLIAEQQDLARLGKYGDTEGLGNLYNGIAGTLTDELASYSGNKAFTDNYMPARAFYKENIINKLRSNTAKSILNEQAPKEAFAYMNTPQRVKELENILGDSHNAKEIMGSLKRAKVSQILSDSGVVNSAGEFNSGAFNRVFSKENREPLLKALMGENYAKVQANILPISNAITSSGKILANPSGTANTLKDTGLIVGAVTGVATGSTGASGVALSGAALINRISRAFADPKYLEKLIARGNRNDKIKDAVKNPIKTIDSKVRDVFSRPAARALGVKMLPQLRSKEKDD